MQKHTLLALAHRGLLAVLSLSLGGFVAPALAGVYQASTDVSLFEQAGGIGDNQFSLPKYLGPGSIIGVTLTLSGSAEGSIFQNYIVQNGITIAPFQRTWDFLVFGPPVSGGGMAAVLHAPTIASYIGISVPPCPSECSPMGSAEVNISSDGVTFFGSVNMIDFSDFAGSGSNDFVFAIFAELGETIGASGTVTETILTSVPEPSTWAMMLLGFAGLGYAGYRRASEQRAAV
jgi:hypothetical protein